MIDMSFWRSLLSPFTSHSYLPIMSSQAENHIAHDGDAVMDQLKEHSKVPLEAADR